MELTFRYYFCAAAMHKYIGAPPEVRLTEGRRLAPATTAPLPALPHGLSVNFYGDRNPFEV